ncbi:MAG: GDSL-type esterase/lipase family protein, partial [Chloroflexota bacterium]|nr:GDSL-type esterase/lipase family protein [Chloroflexota bacterium]
MRSYAWRLEPLDGQLERVLTVSTGACRTQIDLPKLGRWRAHLMITSDRGGREGQQDFRFRDLVIVAFGDSFVSGEGNPEGKQRRGSLDVRVVWTDKQCHRSKHSWAMRAARRLEDATTSVTFLNYACSGATTHDMLYGGYKGIQPVNGDRRLPSQFAAAREALGGPFVPGSRPVHALLMTAGVNDTAFSSVLLACASYNSRLPYDRLLDPLFDEPCTTAGATRSVRGAIGGLRDSYDRLEVALSSHLKVGQVRFVEYPSRVITDGRDRHGGCGILKGISGGEARWITARGDELNGAMRAAAMRNGWRYVGGVRDAFRRHGYCAGAKTWFRSFSGSRKLQ